MAAERTLAPSFKYEGTGRSRSCTFCPGTPAKTKQNAAFLFTYISCKSTETDCHDEIHWITAISQKYAINRVT